MGDVTYGACCVDDLGASALGAELLIHYGHSCLVQKSQMHATVRVLYVFVSIAFDAQHFIQSVRLNFDSERRVGVVATIQFVNALQAVAGALEEHFASVTVPQAHPLSRGEILGCTSPKLDGIDLLMYVIVIDWCSR